MLVLSRKSNQAITIGEDIRITVVKIDGNSVRIGIDAPKDVKVWRLELKDAIDQSKPLKSDL
jgi:carbon storage regulator